eukprot:3931850-Rhodomonas_salina.4
MGCIGWLEVLHTGLEWSVVRSWQIQVKGKIRVLQVGGRAGELVDRRYEGKIVVRERDGDVRGCGRA